MLKFFKILFISTVIITIGGAVAFGVASADSNSNDNSSSNVNSNSGSTAPFTPSTVIKNWHEVE